MPPSGRHLFYSAKEGTEPQEPGSFTYNYPLPSSAAFAKITLPGKHILPLGISGSVEFVPTFHTEFRHIRSPPAYDEIIAHLWAIVNKMAITYDIKKQRYL